MPKVVKKYRPEGWDEYKKEVLDQIKEKVGGDPDAMAVAESIFEMAADCLLDLIRAKNCGTAVCEKGLIYAIFPPKTQLSVPGRRPLPERRQCPFGYKVKENYSGPGMVGFIPDDEAVVL